jgi:hypothetical protein
MNTQQVAKHLIEMCRKGQNMEAIEELYADKVVSKEMPGAPEEVTSGIKEVFAKSEKWLNNVQEFHKSEISDPHIAGNHFSCTMDFDVTFKDRGRQQMKEVCVYEVNNGKIVNEQFFYSM